MSQLAAAFVVTVAAGCGGEQMPPEEPHRNPPGPEVDPVPTSTFATPAGDPTSTGTSTLPAAPQGWNVTPNGDGTCTAYGPDPCNHPGCNPPPPMKVACPPNMPK